MRFKFEELVVWQEAMVLGEDVYKLTRKFPKEEMFGLTSQMTRATDSIALNISEGSMARQMVKTEDMRSVLVQR